MDILQNIFDVIRGKKLLKIVFESSPGYEWKKRTKKQIEDLRKKVKAGEKIRLCFSVVFDSVFPASNLYEKMLDDNIFDPFILVIPDTSRGEENMFYQMNKTYKTLSSKYKNVFNSYDCENQTFIDWSDKIDILCPANPYDVMTDKKYGIKYLTEKGILTFYTSYYYMGKTNYDKNLYKSNEFSLFWKIFTENKYNYKEIKKHISNSNVTVSGYPKMDSLSQYTTCKNQNRKTIIIAPHHSVRANNGNYINISNFLNYYEFFAELPMLYPNINFVFRPHPLLFKTLENEDLWGKNKVKQYINKISSIPNLEYQDGGDYLKTFVESSALINDCNSFLTEYFYTNKPQLFLLQNQLEIDREFTEYGKKVLDKVYKAYSKEDILSFIDTVVLKDNDYMKQDRISFAKNNVIVNYPKATEFILNNLKKYFIGEFLT